MSLVEDEDDEVTKVAIIEGEEMKVDCTCCKLRFCSYSLLRSDPRFAQALAVTFPGRPWNDDATTPNSPPCPVCPIAYAEGMVYVWRWSSDGNTTP